jgi:hypothetical protein
MFVVELNGKILTVPEWAEKLDIPVQTIYARLKNGVTDPALILYTGRVNSYPEPIPRKQKKSDQFYKPGNGRGRPIFPSDALYTCNGESLTIMGWAEKLHYTESGIHGVFDICH